MQTPTEDTGTRKAARRLAAFLYTHRENAMPDWEKCGQADGEPALGPPWGQAELDREEWLEHSEPMGTRHAGLWIWALCKETGFPSKSSGRHRRV